MADEQRDEPTERTPKGLQVPVPKRGEFFDNLKKVARPEPHPESDEDSTTGGAQK